MLKINEQKTKYMIAAGNRTILDARRIVGFDDKKFVYFGALITAKDNVGLEIQQR
jgi:hypothetical protein